MSDKFLSIHTDDAPAAVGPYSQAVRFGNFLFLSGQLGIDPMVQKLVNGGIDYQLDQVFKNVENILNAAGSDMNKVIKVTVFLKNMEFFKQVNDSYAKIFSSPFPARSAVGVADLPLGAEIMLDVIACI